LSISRVAPVANRQQARSQPKSSLLPNEITAFVLLHLHQKCGRALGVEGSLTNPGTAESGVKRNIPGRCGNALAGNHHPGWGDVGRNASGLGPGASFPFRLTKDRGRSTLLAADRAIRGMPGRQTELE
jgi:hypothetical protein